MSVMVENEADIMVATRVDKPLYAKLLKRQRDVKKMTGIAPSVSAIVRALIAEGVDKPATRNAPRRHTQRE